MRRLLLDIDANGYTLTGLAPKVRLVDFARGVDAVPLPSMEDEASDPALGLLCSGRDLGGLLAMLSTQISAATGQDVTLEVKA